MSEPKPENTPQGPQEPPPEPPKGQDTPPEPQDPQDPPQEPETFPRAVVEQLRKENAEARTKAKRVDDLAAALVVELARGTQKLADPTDLPMSDELLDDDGMPDPEKITAAVEELLTRKPHLGDRRPRGDVGQGATGGAGDVDLAGLLRARA